VEAVQPRQGQSIPQGSVFLQEAADVILTISADFFFYLAMSKVLQPNALVLPCRWAIEVAPRIRFRAKGHVRIHAGVWVIHARIIEHGRGIPSVVAELRISRSSRSVNGFPVESRKGRYVQPRFESWSSRLIF